MKGGNRRDALAWSPLLQQLHQLRNPQPHLHTATQQFMLDYPREVSAAFVSRHGDGKTMGSAQRMNL